MHRKIGYTLRPTATHGGLSRIDVPYAPAQASRQERPDPKTWEDPQTSINDPKVIATHVCAANARQYNQAYQTPCGTEPLASHLGYKADTVGAEHVIQGEALPPNIADELLPETKDIFQTLSSLATQSYPQTSTRITSEQFIACYKAMDEQAIIKPPLCQMTHVPFIAS
jgi:hypothetical protein